MVVIDSVVEGCFGSSHCNLNTHNKNSKGNLIGSPCYFLSYASNISY